MRNLKRALSLALASVMLMGMMVVGTSAASTSGFTDADKISNAEAVDLTTGLEIFKGYTDGSFGPEKAVTRAEAAVVIAKILHGSDVNPANFAGAGKFNDVEKWAEGYVNLVSSLGIIVGRGEGIFDPNATVTTVEFSTMLLKALGYYVEADALGADWKLEVTSKANALGLYGDLELAMNAPLTRENVAVLTMNALFAQRVAYDDVRGLYVKNSDRNVVVTNGTEDEYNTLAQNTYGLYAVEGLVWSNGAIDVEMDGKTLVKFEDDKDVTGDKKVESEYKFEFETGVDMIGHAATVYYTIEKKAPVVYAIVDDATLVVETFGNANLTNLAKANGFDRDTTDTQVIKNYDLSDVNATYHTKSGYPVILISNSADLTVDFEIVLYQDLDYVTKVTVDDSDEEAPITSYALEVGSTLTDDTNCVVVGEVEKADYVILTYVAATKTTIVEAADTEVVMLTEVVRSNNDTDKIYSGETSYSAAKTNVDDALIDTDVKVKNDDNHNGTCAEAYAVTPYIDILVAGEYTLIYDNYGRVIAVCPVVDDHVVNVAYAAQFGYKINTLPSLNDDYLMTAHIYFADGTDAVYYVDNTDGIFENAKVEKDGKIVNKSATKTNELVAAGLNNVTMLNDNIVDGAGDFVKLYDITVNADNTVTFAELEGQGIVGDKLVNHLNSGIVASVIDQIKKGVTFLGDSNKLDFYGNSETLFWFVDGVYTDDTLVVGTATGMKNVPTIDVDGKDNNDEGVVAQAAATQKKDAKYATVDTVLVAGYEYVTTQSGIYYYDGVYTVTRIAADEYTLGYKMYDITTGEAYTMSYADIYTTDAAARKAAKDVKVGFYKDGGEAVEAYAIDQTKLNDVKSMMYAVEAEFVNYIDLGDTLTMYTELNKTYGGVTIDEDTLFIDLTGNKLTSLEALDDLLAANKASYENAKKTWTGYANLSYVYDDEDNLVDIIFVTYVTGDYDKDYIDEATGSLVKEIEYTVTVDAVNGTIDVVYTAGADAEGKAVVPTLSDIARAIQAELGADASKVVAGANKATVTNAAGDVEIEYALSVSEGGAQ